MYFLLLFWMKCLDFRLLRYRLEVVLTILMGEKNQIDEKERFFCSLSFTKKEEDKPLRVLKIDFGRGFFLSEVGWGFGLRLVISVWRSTDELVCFLLKNFFSTFVGVCDVGCSSMVAFFSCFGGDVILLGDNCFEGTEGAEVDERIRG